MSNKMKLYQIIANLISVKDLFGTFYDESEQILFDDYEECYEYLNNALDVLLKYMPCITDNERHITDNEGV